MEDENKPNLAQEAGGFVADATVDTQADNFINTAIDDVAERIPGGSNFEQVIKTGVDLQANNAINSELSRVEGMFGHKESDQSGNS